MTRQDFLASIDEILELAPGTLKGPESLEDYPLWDSTAVISFMAVADNNNGAHLAPRDISGCKTVADLLRIAKVGD
jgi:acyl carrier protein